MVLPGRNVRANLQKQCSKERLLKKPEKCKSYLNKEMMFFSDLNKTSLSKPGMQTKSKDVQAGLTGNNTVCVVEKL